MIGKIVEWLFWNKKIWIEFFDWQWVLHGHTSYTHTNGANEFSCAKSVYSELILIALSPTYKLNKLIFVASTWSAAAGAYIAGIGFSVYVTKKKLFAIPIYVYMICLWREQTRVTRQKKERPTQIDRKSETWTQMLQLQTNWQTEHLIWYIIAR